MSSGKPIVVVIGAGSAGLRAAVDLIGKAEVVVLEAKNRTGGRVWTAKFSDGGWADLGAAFILGAGDKNPVVQLFKEFGGPISPEMAAASDRGRVAVWGNTGAAGDIGVMRKAGACDMMKGYWAFHQSHELWKKDCGERDKRDGKFTGPDDNLWDGLRKLKGTGCMGFKGLDSLDETTLAQVKFWWRLATEHEICLPMEQLSYRWHQEEFTHDGVRERFGSRGPDMPIGGWQVMTDHLEKVASAGGVKIRLETVVVAVRQDGGRSGVVVELASGEKIQCAACICTLPHGVLKSGNVTWEPKLPELKLDAINRLQSGCFNRVAIRFDKVFWKTSPSAPCTGGTPHMHLILDMDSGRHAPEAVHPCFLMDTEPITKSKVIVVFYSAKTAEIVEKMTDEQTLEHSLKCLEASFGKQVRQAKVEEYYFSRWKADPFALGVYAATPAGTSGEIRDHLASPHGSVFFAGEATIKGLCASVAGALVSGSRAAGEVAAHLQR